jgi:hypothetical protein
MERVLFVRPWLDDRMQLASQCQVMIEARSLRGIILMFPDGQTAHSPIFVCMLDPVASEIPRLALVEHHEVIEQLANTPFLGGL